jgi:hypothetical protein
MSGLGGDKHTFIKAIGMPTIDVFPPIAFLYTLREGLRRPVGQFSTLYAPLPL